MRSRVKTRDARGVAGKPDPDLGGLCGPSAARHSPQAGTPKQASALLPPHEISDFAGTPRLAHVCRIRLLRCSPPHETHGFRGDPESAAPCGRPTYATDLSAGFPAAPLGSARAWAEPRFMPSCVKRRRSRT